MGIGRVPVPSKMGFAAVVSWTGSAVLGAMVLFG